MENYHALLRTTLDTGVDQFNARTNKLCRALVGYQLQYDLSQGFPAITTKKLAFNNLKGELLGFFRGYDNAADFRKLGCTVWDQNANETQAWLQNPARRGHDHLGRVYGCQWVDWIDRRVASSLAERDILLDRGFEQEMHDPIKTTWLMRRGINQLENALRTIITNPSDRRIIVSGWNPAELDQMALPPCHMDYRFVPIEDTKTLHVVVTIRSLDIFLGAPFNIASSAIFLSVMARLSGYTPGTVTIQATNAHIYSDHFDQVRELLTREHFAPPQLKLSENIRQVENLDDIAGVFTRIETSDISLVGYQSHAAIKAPMSA